MMRPPRLLRDEQMKLINEYFSIYPDDEKKLYNIDEERLENKRMNEWLYNHASELLQRYWDYRNRIGDEGQLCDGEGNILYLQNDSRDCIQDWDVNEEGYCVFPGTSRLILNVKGKPIKNPVLDPRVEELYLSERVICVADMAAMVVKQFPEQMDKIEEAMVDNTLLGHIFAHLAISLPMKELFYSDKKKFGEYCELVEELWRYGDDNVQNIIDVTILEDLNDGDENVWKGLCDFSGEDFKHYLI